MEIKISSDLILKILLVLAWIIFAGLGIEAGGFITNTVFTLLYNPDGAQHLWKLIDLNDLYHFNQSHFVVQSCYIIIIAILKTLLFYLIVRILHSKKINMKQPFNTEVGRFIFKMAYLALGIGLFSSWSTNFTAWLISQGVKMPDTKAMGIDGADVWLFMGVILLVIGHIFKKGIEIQTENELTI